MKEGWRIKTLKSIGRTQTGTTPPTNDVSNYGDYIPFVKPAYFNKNGEIVSDSSGLSQIGLSKGRLFEANSVLMVCIGATGKVGFCTVPVSRNQQINVLTSEEDCDYKLLFYGMKSPVF
jgi:type I restriction enzyme S subunit